MATKKAATTKRASRTASSRTVAKKKGTKKRPSTKPKGTGGKKVGKTTSKRTTSAKPKPAKKPRVKRKPSAAFMKPVQPDALLAAVVGSDPLPRTELTKKLWIYIKRNNLQHPTNRRNIVADAKLKPVFGGRAVVTMFEMTKLVSNHVK